MESETNGHSQIGVRISKVYSVTDVDIQYPSMADGSPQAVIVSAKGKVNTGGWSNGELAAYSYVAPPADGILSFDFIAQPPRPGSMNTMAFATIVGSVGGHFPPWVKGVRIVAATNEMVAMLEVGAAAPSGGDPTVPWPWPWFTPDTTPTE